jgi:hypothetical protein
VVVASSAIDRGNEEIDGLISTDAGDPALRNAVSGCARVRHRRSGTHGETITTSLTASIPPRRARSYLRDRRAVKQRRQQCQIGFRPLLGRRSR